MRQGAVLTDISSRPGTSAETDASLPSMAEGLPRGATLMRDCVGYRTIQAPLADAVTLCLFDPHDLRREIDRIPMQRMDDGSFAVVVPINGACIGAGTPYGFRAEGPWDPDHNRYFNENILLPDSHGSAIAVPLPNGKVNPRGMEIYAPEHFRAGLIDDGKFYKSPYDNAAFAPKSIVIDHGSFDWQEDQGVIHNRHEAVIIEMHVRGLTKNMPELPPELRGTFAGLGTEAVVDRFGTKGNVFQLMPVTAMVSEPRLIGSGLVNYWGYNPFAFMSPDPRLCASRDPQDQVNEFKAAIRFLHQHDISIILDTVFNHTGEGSPQWDPFLGLRGLNPEIYLSYEGHQMNWSGCGCTLDPSHPVVRELILNTLSHWHTHFHIDGNRYDLASHMGLSPRDSGQGWIYSSHSPTFAAINRRFGGKLHLAENWMSALAPPEAYQPHVPPVGMSTFDPDFQKTARNYAKGTGRGAYGLSGMLWGNSEKYGHASDPTRAVRFVACHDGFTLMDWAMYWQKHNEANGEANRDGNDDNNSWHFHPQGKEGPSDDPKVTKERLQRVRFLAALPFVSQGIPFLQAGDAFLHSQGGNNNAYCQDNGISYINFAADPSEGKMSSFYDSLFRFRRDHPMLQREVFASENFGTGEHTVMWFSEHGYEMRGQDWSNACLAMYLSNMEYPSSSSLLVIVNAEPTRRISWKLPSIPERGKEQQWQLLWNTAFEEPFSVGEHNIFRAGDKYKLQHSSLAVFSHIGKSPYDVLTI